VSVEEWVSVEECRIPNFGRLFLFFYSFFCQFSSLGVLGETK
jgi:hypothetical protein